MDWLIRENIGLIGPIVAEMMRSFPQLPAGYDRDDLASLSYIGLIQAVQTFDPERGVLFSTYAGRCIENKIRAAITRAQERQGDP